MDFFWGGETGFKIVSLKKSVCSETGFKKQNVLPSEKDSRRLTTIRVIPRAEIERLGAARESQDQITKKKLGQKRG